MSKKIISIVLIVFFIAAAGAWSQNAVTFSFASDDNHAGKNFFCDVASPRIIYAGQVPVDLMVDRNDTMNGGIVTIQSYMRMRASIFQYQCVPHGSGFLHIWSMKGYIRFYHVDTPLLPILHIYFYNAVLTSYSPNNVDAGETLTLQVSESVDLNMNMTPMNLLPGIGVNAGDLIAHEDFAFTFTNITTASGSILIPLAAGGVFADSWEAEGSFSGSGMNP